MLRFLISFLCVFSCVATAAQHEEYRLATGDTIHIAVYEEADLSFEIKIDETGLFEYPYLEPLQLLGKTTSQLEQEITQGLLGRVLINPNIAVSVKEYRPFSIGGEVVKPGSYPYTLGLTVKKAINIAGGKTDWASPKRFEIQREKSALEEKKYTLDSPVLAGDILTILPRRF